MFLNNDTTALSLDELCEAENSGVTFCKIGKSSPDISSRGGFFPYKYGINENDNFSITHLEYFDRVLTFGDLLILFSFNELKKQIDSSGVNNFSASKAPTLPDIENKTVNKCYVEEIIDLKKSEAVDRIIELYSERLDQDFLLEKPDYMRLALLDHENCADLPQSKKEILKLLYGNTYFRFTSLYHQKKYGVSDKMLSICYIVFPHIEIDEYFCEFQNEKLLGAHSYGEMRFKERNYDKKSMLINCITEIDKELQMCNNISRIGIIIAKHRIKKSLMKYKKFLLGIKPKSEIVHKRIDCLDDIDKAVDSVFAAQLIK